MITTEFFKTLQEAKAFLPCRCRGWDVYSLDKPGTVNKFRVWQNDAIANERYAEAENARAVVVIYR